MTHLKEEMPLDVLFIGGGPANLAGAIHLVKLAQEKGLKIEVGLIEKADTIGAHSLSGAILDPIALKELIPDYIEKGCPVEETECSDNFYYLTRTRSYSIPYAPKYMHNNGCFIISLSKFTRWLGDLAEKAGVNIFPGFAGTEVLFNADTSHILGVSTGDKGVNKYGKNKSNFESGINLIAKVTIFGEGPKGNLIREVDKKMGIFSGRMPQSFETAMKEVIQLPESNTFISSGTTVLHTFGYPLGLNTKGGGFLYKMEDNRISLGLVIGLDYKDPLIEPYKAFIQLKKHPLIAKIIRGGKVLQQGAKTLSAGGYFTMPKLAVNGALFAGDSASMLNIQRLKGIHTAMKSGMLAAEATISALEKNDYSIHTLGEYESKLMQSWIKDELYQARNFSQALSKKGLKKFLHLGAQYLTNGRGFKDPLTIEEDSSTMKEISAANVVQDINTGSQDIDSELYIDKLTGIYLSGTKHEEDQPCHLIVHDQNICIGECYKKYRNPCTRFCPGQVYEIEKEESEPQRLKLNPSNCLHCKTCEIKDPFKNITWTCPQGGGGPNYSIL